MQLQTNPEKKKEDNLFKSNQNTMEVLRNIFRGLEVTNTVRLMF